MDKESLRKAADLVPANHLLGQKGGKVGTLWFCSAVGRCGREYVDGESFFFLFFSTICVHTYYICTCVCVCVYA